MLVGGIPDDQFWFPSQVVMDPRGVQVWTMEDPGATVPIAAMVLDLMPPMT